MQRKSWRKFDLWMVLCVLALVCFGLVAIRSATLLAGTPVSRQLLTQGVYAAIGLSLMVAIAAIDYRVIGALAPVLYVGMIGLLGLVLVAGITVFGAQRWIGYGPFSFQPSELAKVVIIVCLARFWASREDSAGSLKTLLLSLGIVALPVVLVYRQPDLGTSLVLLAAWFGIAFAAGASLKWLGVALAVPFVGFPLVWRLMKEYMRRRLLAFLAPEKDPLGEGYNLIQARISVGSGGWWGRGLGNGTQTQLNFLRVQHTDFIFAVLGEELGFIGALALLSLFGALFWRCLRVAAHSRDTFGKLLAVGITSMLLFQVFVNIGMNIGLLPVAGIPLPFISVGGSSLISIFIGLGILQSVLIHSQARRYDTKPNVRVPATLRLRRAHFPLGRADGRPQPVTGAAAHASASRFPVHTGAGR
ncbi:MAG: rod shape-determining protein RodA [Chloroflexota bacterium]